MLRSERKKIQMLSKANRIVNARSFSVSSLSSFDWQHRGSSWDVSYTVVSPEDPARPKKTFVLFPSTTLLSTREEWRETANLLSNVGYESILLDWPGWHKQNSPMNWSLEDDVKEGTIVSTFTDFAHVALKHVHSTRNPDAEIHVVCVGLNSVVHVRRALDELSGIHIKSLICFSPTWRFYLPRSVPDGYPRKLVRRQGIADWFLSNWFVRSKLCFRIYKSKFGLSKITRRLYEEKLQFTSELLLAKRDVIVRDRPLSIDAAMIAGHFDVANTTRDFVQLLFGLPEETHPEDDEDDEILGIHVPNWATSKPTPTTSSETKPTLLLHLVVPQDVNAADRKELDSILAHRGNVTVKEVPGKLFSHEEYPAVAAEAIDSLVVS